MFKYFRNPEKFAFLEGELKTCGVCGKPGELFSANGFRGELEVSCICGVCMNEGVLCDMEIYTNEAYGGSPEETDIVQHSTPSLSSWQDMQWPIVNGEYLVFEKIASKLDFSDENDFYSSFPKLVAEESDLPYLWEQLPNHKIGNLKEGNYNVSVYLFSGNGMKYCLWDAN